MAKICNNCGYEPLENMCAIGTKCPECHEGHIMLNHSKDPDLYSPLTEGDFYVVSDFMYDSDGGMNPDDQPI